MGRRPRFYLSPDLLYPPMPDQVRKEIVDILAEALVLEIQENQRDRNIIVVSRSRTHNTNEGTDEIDSEHCSCEKPF